MGALPHPLMGLLPGRLASVAMGSIAIAIIGMLSHFKPGQSKDAQRAWLMT